MTDQINIPLGEESGPERPEPVAPADFKLIDKFDSPAALQNAYLELERKLGNQPQAQVPDPIQTLAPTVEMPDHETAIRRPELDLNIPVPEAGQPAQSTEAANAEFLEKCADEYIQNKSLSAPSYAELAKRGIPRNFVDSYIQGVQAQEAQQTAAAFEITGGQEGYQSMVQWAQDNVPREDLVATNNALQGNDVSMALNALRGLWSRFQQSGGAPAQAGAEGFQGAGPSVRPFQSEQEVSAAMRDPRYRTGDPAYVQAVTERLRDFQGFVHTKVR